MLEKQHLALKSLCRTKPMQWCAGLFCARTIILSMIISGALAGVGSVVEGLGTFQSICTRSSLAVGFNGYGVSLLTSNSPGGIQFDTSYLQCSSPVLRYEYRNDSG